VINDELIKEDYHEEVLNTLNLYGVYTEVI